MQEAGKEGKQSSPMVSLLLKGHFEESELLHGAQWFSKLWGHKSLKSSETMNHILQKKRNPGLLTPNYVLPTTANALLQKQKNSRVT